jgi:hypothetical protein
MTYKSYKMAYTNKFVRKTLYFDKDTDDILQQMPEKKQSEFVREAVKHYFYNKDAIIQAKPSKLKITKVIA